MPLSQNNLNDNLTKWQISTFFNYKSLKSKFIFNINFSVVIVITASAINAPELIYNFIFLTRRMFPN